MESLKRDGTDTEDFDPGTKRRKLRKGATSCWYCKKRKVKCIFEAHSDTVCVACRRRGTSCVSQDQPEETVSVDNKCTLNAVLDRLQGVELLLQQLLEAKQNTQCHPSSLKDQSITLKGPDLFPLANETTSGDSPEPSGDGCFTQDGAFIYARNKHRALADDLIQAFPSKNDIEAFCNKDRKGLFYYHQILVKSGDWTEQEARTVIDEIARIPDPSTTSLAVVAKRMIILALFLQFFRHQVIHNLTEDPNTVMNRLVDTAERLVLSNERLMDCAEGLECIVLESVFQANAGNLRRAWLSCRKAMSIAQLIGIDPPDATLTQIPDQNTTVGIRLLWFRIVHMDSFLSLVLGLPYGGQETYMEGDFPGESPNCKLKKMHTLIARSINQRNRHKSAIQDASLVHRLDQELLDAAKSLPHTYWLTPSFANIRPNTRAALLETTRLYNQLHHFNLVHLLHLPYLLQRGEECSYHTFSKFTCVNASREILHRFIALYNFNQHVSNIYCPIANIIAFMAALTLLLAHMNDQKLKVEDWHAHQRSSDRAMVEKLFEALQQLGNECNDSQAKASALQVRALLDSENSAACGSGPSVQDAVRSLAVSARELQLLTPYYVLAMPGGESIQKDRDDIRSALNSSIYDKKAAEKPNVSFTEYKYGAGGVSSQPSHLGTAAGVQNWDFQAFDAGFFNSILSGVNDWD